MRKWTVAERWLTAAEKLLATRDYHGAKSFAIRARDSNPRLEAADRMLAVVETLLSGEHLINGKQLDWYGILQLGRPTQSLDLIADNYRRLALLLNPDRNHFPFADQAFRLVSQAWSFLCNTNKKVVYDNELRIIQSGHVRFQRSPPPTKTSRNKDLHDPPSSVHEDRPPILNNDGETSRKPARRGRPPLASSSAAPQPDPDSFWTACPYCYILCEYPRAYEECALKCQGCERAFQAVEVASPPVTDKDTFYNCWAYFPLGFLGNDNGPGDGPSWKPLSSMFIPLQKNKKGKRGVSTAPRIYYDDDDIYVEVSDPSDDSDDSDWGAPPSTPKKRGRPPKVKSPATKSGTKKNSVERPMDTGKIPPEKSSVAGAESLGSRPSGNPVDCGEPSGKGLGNPVRKQTGRGAKALGKLDLNVEFSNEVEEPSKVVNACNKRGHGEEDNMEGTEFFEGLDEFLVVCLYFLW
ncbi:hypothetical protein SAY87_000345 [Trapa incisa]|uniref:J domain-containing protein n=1 Tax=Trapa incisa TaxID=236973 RepID=A0AAN7JG49_9MYRT|nr:hypothetical protein SAY87_000345 [Trapa incisa]